MSDGVIPFELHYRREANAKLAKLEALNADLMARLFALERDVLTLGSHRLRQEVLLAELQGIVERLKRRDEAKQGLEQGDD